MYTSVFSHKQSPSGSNSKGNQVKWLHDGWYYKQDLLGYEALSEVVASRLAVHTNLAEFGITEYEPCRHPLKSDIVCCRSKSYNPENYPEMTLLKLLTRYYNTDLEGVYKYYFDNCDVLLESFYDFVKETILEAVGFDASTLFALLLRFDWLILNEDRHFRNIAFLQGPSGFLPSPLFDNGAAFLSDTISYESNVDFRLQIDSIQAKPFNSDFKIQVLMVESKSAELLQFDTSIITLHCSDLLSYYDIALVQRVQQILEFQLKLQFPYITLKWS